MVWGDEWFRTRWVVSLGTELALASALNTLLVERVQSSTSDVLFFPEERREARLLDLARVAATHVFGNALFRIPMSPRGLSFLQPLQPFPHCWLIFTDNSSSPTRCWSTFPAANQNSSSTAIPAVSASIGFCTRRAECVENSYLEELLSRARVC